MAPQSRRAAGRRLVGQGRRRSSRAGPSTTGAPPASAPCPTAVVRRSAYIAPGVVLMPSLRQSRRLCRRGARWSTPGRRSGSCAQIGKNVHLSGGVGIGGVLEPMQAGPDDHRGQLLHRRPLRGGRGRASSREGSVLGMGVFIGAVDEDRRPGDRRDLLRRGAALFGGGGRGAAGQAVTRTAAPAPASTAPSSSRPSTSRPALRPRSTSCCRD